MKYFVIATKHHEGFALWDSEYDYKVTNTPASEVIYKEHDSNLELTHTIANVMRGSVTLELPVQKPDAAVPVIEIFLKNE
ncbi:alpha-L-fucosidase [Bacillus niameyensis]|uniref:alpha-L-fucosidase n=1 Tax=Bacillus niameyensis TaxID=1522308 RepID=UPI00078574D8|nr:alpha-L-fucosidase [Bacillus niameyensis]